MPTAKKAPAPKATKVSRKTSTKVGPHEAPVLAIVLAGGKIVSAGADGRVLCSAFGEAGLVPEGALRDEPNDPAATLAALGDRVAGASAKTLLVWDASGAEVARTKLSSLPAALVARGERLFVLGGGKVTVFELTGGKLVAKGSVAHAKGRATELDVDATGKLALVVRDGNEVEVLDLGKKKKVAAWTRKGGATSVSARFLPGRADALLAASDNEVRLQRLKLATGRMTAEVLWLDAHASGPLALDAGGTVVAVPETGENVEVVELGRPGTCFLLDPAITPADEKVLASLKSIPKFELLAPGLFVQRGSTAAPPEPRTLSACALDAGGRTLAAGFVSGEIVVADTATGRVASTHRGLLADARCAAVRPVTVFDLVGSAQNGAEVWFLLKDGILVADLAGLTLRDGPRLERVGEHAGLSFDGDFLVCTDGRGVSRYARRGGAPLLERAVPESRGWFVRGGEVLYAPVASVGHEGFDICAMDIETGATRAVGRFVRDPERFPLGNDPKGWVRMGALGERPTVTIWAGRGLTVAQTYFLDPVTGTCGERLAWNTGRLSHDERTVADAEGAGITVRDLATGAIVHHVDGEFSRIDPAFDPETRVSAGVVRGRAHVAVFEADGQRRLTLYGHRDPKHLWIAPGGNALLVMCRGGLRLWNVA